MKARVERTPIPNHPGVNRRTWTAPDGRRRIRYDATYRGDDRREHSRSFARLSDADRWLRNERGSKDRGVWTDPGDRTSVGEWAARWMSTRTPELSPKTAAVYEGLLRTRILPTFGSYRPSRILPSDVQVWIAGMVEVGLSPSRIRQAHVLLSSMLRAAERDGLVGRNAAAGARLPRLEHREAAYFAPEVVERIAGATPVPFDLLVRILGTLGPRFGEAAALRRRDVNLLTRRLLIERSVTEVNGRLVEGATKSHSARSVPLPPSIMAALERHLEDWVDSTPDSLLFTDGEGGQLRYSNFRTRLWRTALQRLGLPMVGMHTLRHSAAAGMISAGADAKAIQRVLGHRSVAFSLTTYGHLLDSDLDDLARRLDLTGVRDIRGIAVAGGPGADA
jgi:integrase